MTNSPPDEQRIRQSFADQAASCAAFGSPFTAQLVEGLGHALDHETHTGRRVLGWQGETGSGGDAVALRLAGALHTMVRRSRLPDLARHYPPNGLPDHAALRDAALEAITANDAEIAGFLDYAPQTNEVGRSALLYPGFAVIGAKTGLPLSLFEVGASAGLNLIADQYVYDLGGTARGVAGSPVRLAPPWKGGPPAAPDPKIVARRGCDLNPLDLNDDDARHRMLGYIWPDQTARLRRIEAAVDLVRANPPVIDQADAADWVEDQIPAGAGQGTARVLYHSIAYQYFPEPVKERIRAHMWHAGSVARPENPLAWLSFEVAEDGRPALTLTTWPGGETRTLARANAHVHEVTWHG